MNPEPSPHLQPPINRPLSPLQSSDPGLEGEIASKPDHLAVRFGGPKTLWIVLAVLLCIFSSGLMMMLPSRTTDVESVYGGF